MKKATKENINMIPTLASFFKYIGRYKIWVYSAILFAFIAAVLNLIGPHKLSDVTNMILEGVSGTMDITKIVNICIFLAIIYILGFILNYLQGYLMTNVAQKVSQTMRNEMIKKINRLPLAYFDTHPIGDTLSRIANDVDTIGQMMNQSLSTIVSSLALFVGSIFMMFFTNWILALCAILSSLIGMLFIFKIIMKSQNYFTQQQTVLGQLDGHIEEVFSGHLIVKAYNNEKNVRDVFHRMNQQLYTCVYKSQFLSGLMMPFMIFIGNLSYVVVCVVGSVLVMKGQISFGIIVSFMLYIRIFTQPLQNLSQAASSLQSMTAACHRIFTFLNEEEMEIDQVKDTLTQVNGKIEFNHVAFGYSKNKTIIHDFCAHIKPGQKVAIVGPTGAGKTTIVNLLMRFYEVNTGNITIDDINIHDISKENLHDVFAMVLQDTWLFEGTLRENLVYNRTDVSEEQLNTVCERVGIHDWVHSLEKGYDTVLDDNTNISTGQKQLLTIARAMLKKAPLLILDEATSSVDTRTEIQVQKAMDELMKDKTSFVIAHRLSTIKDADLILVLKDGDIIEKGKHDTLLKENGFYAQLYNSQFANI